jgi:hypothetical protein
MGGTDHCGMTGVRVKLPVASSVAGDSALQLQLLPTMDVRVTPGDATTQLQLLAPPGNSRIPPTLHAVGESVAYWHM